MTLILVLVLVSSNAHAGLVLHWALDEGEGTTAYDSANGYDGTIHGAAWTSGKFGGALDFDGIDDYVGTLNDVLSNAQLAPGATLTAWFKTDSTALGCIADNEGYMNLGVNHTDAPNPNTLFGMVDGGSHKFFSSSNVNDNFWHHASIVWDGTNTAILYLDGVNVSSGVSNSPTPDSKHRPFTIGATSYLSESGFFNGSIDDVRIYNHALSPGEIQQIIPEPATVLLLSLGGLLIRKKR